MSQHGAHLDELAWRVAGSPCQDEVVCPDCGATWTVRSVEGSTVSSPDGYGLRATNSARVVAGTPCNCAERRRQAEMAAMLAEQQRIAAAEKAASEAAKVELASLSAPDPDRLLVGASEYGEDITVAQFIAQSEQYAAWADPPYTAHVRQRSNGTVVLFAEHSDRSVRVICTQK